MSHFEPIFPLTMDPVTLKKLLDENDQKGTLAWMERSTGNYQVFDPYLDPVLCAQGSLTESKLAQLRYQTTDFAGRSVADLGSNLGFFAFQALCLNARSVTAFEHESSVVESGNLLRDSYEARFPHYQGKLNFVLKELNTLPELPRHDILLVNSLIHWIFVFNKAATMDQIADWLYANCNEAVFFEGCVSAEEPVMKQYGVEPSRLSQEVFLDAMSARFGKRSAVTRMNYNPMRIAVRFYK